MRDQTFAISSEQGLACLQAEREEKLQQDEDKKKKQMAMSTKQGTQPQFKSKQGVKKSLKRRFEQVLDQEETSEESFSLDKPPISPISSDDPALLFKNQYPNELMEITDRNVDVGQIVMTKIQRKGVSQKGRKSTTICTCLFWVR